MNFKPGDKVIFLNEKGGGVVTRIISEEIVSVAIDDGFEVPYSVKDLLKTGGAGAMEAERSIISGEQEAADENLTPLFSTPNDTHQKAGGVYLAMVPQNQDKPLESAMDFFLLNHSPYEMLFALYLNRSGEYFGLEFGFVEPDSKLFLKAVERTEIEEWANGMVQVVFFREGKTSPLPPAAGDIAFKPVKIYKEDSFSWEALLRKKVLMVECLVIDKLLKKPDAGQDITPDNIKFLREKMGSTRPAAAPPNKESFLDKHKVDDKIAEVDLHIGELVDNFTNLSNVDMLNIQMDYLKKCMQQAMAEKLSKIIFIHGVGQGTLKNEILRFLRKTDGIEFYDAPYARYGLGATEVFFYRNK
jgi:hypothetical protein